uniref:Uncharacterized protein n=1 Tax=Pseudictyota dubia TaxID=2749911 RepID=A0A7R9W4W9_9STRA
MNLAGSSHGIADDLHEVGTNSVPIRNFLVERLGNFCPNDPNLQDHTGVDFDAIAAEAVQNLELLQNFVDNEVVSFRDYVGQVEDASKGVDAAISSYDVSEWKVMLYVLPMIILPSFLMIGLFMAWFEVSFKEYQCMLRYLIIPLFGIIVVFSWVFCSLFGLLSVTNADFCSGGTANPSPEGTFMEILSEQGITPDSIVYRSVEYYVDGCRTGFPFAFISSYENDLGEAIDSTTTFSNSLDAVGMEDLNRLCGTDFSDVAEQLVEIRRNLETLIGSASRGLQLLSCESLNSLYVNTFHEGTCTYSVSGFAWVFASLLIVSICGMIMITLRSAVYDVVWLEDQAEIEGERGRRSGKEYFDDDHDAIEHTETGVYADESSHPHATAPTEGDGSWDNYPNQFAQDHGDYAAEQGRDW